MATKVVKATSEQRAQWPLDPFLDMRDNPDHPADLSSLGWVFEFAGKFCGDNVHPSLKGQTHYCRWLMASWSCHEGKAVKQAFLDRCKKEGVTFVLLFKQMPPMSTMQVRQCEEFNAKMSKESSVETAAA
jgi:hypothetical protein